MTASGSPPHNTWRSRQRDRRAGFETMLASLVRTLDGPKDPTLLRPTFEAALRELVPVQSIQLRESASQWPRHSEGSIGGEILAFNVPGGDGAPRAVLEATFDPGADVGEWERQLLSGAAHVGALVLEIERVRARLAGVLAVPKARRDGAAPLIGSTPTMHTLRSNIERVAGTDFTVLLEGESDPQQKAKHCEFP